MIVAEQKRKENIIEYVLYMWNVEDLVRSLNLNISAIDEKIISQYQVDDKKREEVRNWYLNIIREMKHFGLIEKGHLPELNELVTEISMLHDSLIHLYQDPRYIELERHASENLKELMKKSGNKSISAVEAGLNGLYGILLLRLKNRMISKDTENSIRTVSDMFAYLALKYKDMKSGNLSFPAERRN